ncbi:MAG: alpha-ribazole phosphatase [Firmicutes bacterium]|nr:alpha-ribazole phosphatase [Bacillota bacterium]
MKDRLLYLLRHGEIDTGGKKRFIGQIDLPLNETGKLQARQLQLEFSGFRVGGIYCSDLQRSRVTAETIAVKHRVQPVIRADLREINLGEWEGMPFDEVRRRFPAEFEQRGREIATYHLPGGESFQDCQDRVVAALEDILAASKGNLIIVGHAGVNRVLLSYMLGMPTENIFRINQDYGCINLIGFERGGFRLKTLNRTSRMVAVLE